METTGDATDAPRQDTVADEEISLAREARRKRILENANKRLGKITGRQEEEFKKDAEIDVVYPDPDTEVFEDYPPTEFNSDFQPMSPMNDQIFQQLLQTMMTNAGGATSNSMHINNPEPEAPDNFIVKLLNSRLPIVFLAIVVFLIFHTGYESLLSGNVFLTLLLWEAVEIFILEMFNKLHQKKSSSMLNVVVVLAGVPQTAMESLGKIVSTVTKILQDVSVFMFVFISLHCCLR